MAPLHVGMIATGGIARTHATDYYSRSPAEAELVATILAAYESAATLPPVELARFVSGAFAHPR